MEVPEVAVEFYREASRLGPKNEKFAGDIANLRAVDNQTIFGSLTQDPRGARYRRASQLLERNPERVEKLH